MAERGDRLATESAAHRRWRWAVLALFFTNGASFSSFFPRVPEVRDRLDLSLTGLGAVLLGIGLGGLLSSVVAGAVVDRVGSRRGAVGAAAVLSLGLPLLGLAPTPLLLTLSLILLSTVDALADIAMNVQAAEVQRTSDRSVVQRFHAMWSVGSVTGAGLGTVAAAADVSLTVQLTATGAVLAAIALSTWTALPAGIRAHDEDDAGGVRRLPVVALLAATALAVAVLEGTPGDWAAVFAADVHGAGAGLAGVGYLAVTSGMVAGRFGGDAATDAVGERRLFVTALVVVAIGLGVVVTSPGAGVAVAGFVVIGLGNSVLFPALYLQAATTPGVPAGLGVGVMSSAARLGFLVSPPLVGAVAGATELRVGLGAVMGAAAVLAAALGALGRRMARGAPPTG